MRSRLLLVLALLLSFSVAACDEEAPGESCSGLDCGLDIRSLDVPEDTAATDAEDTTAAPDTEADTFVPICSDGDTDCANNTTALRCVGGRFVEEPCEDGAICIDDACQQQTCTPGLPFGCETSGQETDQIRICNDDGVTYTVRDCPTGQKCFDGVCAEQVCNPGERTCKNAEEVEVCNDAGTGYIFAELCGEIDGKATLCQGAGQCTTLCSINNKLASFLGCEYIAVDLDNSGSSDDQPFGVTVSNPDPNRVATVVITGGACADDAACPGEGVCDAGTCRVEATVPSLGLTLIELSPDTDVDLAGVHSGATFKVDASIPVTVHQFNPLNGVGVFSNDASLLLPTNALGTRYKALMTPTAPEDPSDRIFGERLACNSDRDCNTRPKTTCGPGGECVIECETQSDCVNADPSLFCSDAGTCAFGPAAVYTDVIGTVDGTTVTVTSPLDIPASDGFPGVPADTPTAFTLNAGELLHLLSPRANTVDISGLDISASAPVSVFSGGVCSNVPDDTPYCDHVEQQLFPVETWGDAFVAAKSVTRGDEDDLWRVIAANDGTTLTIDPPQTRRADGQAVTTATLNAGEVLELVSTEDFEVKADGPIMVGQFWTGSNYPGITFNEACTDTIDLIRRGPCRDATCQSVGGDRCESGNTCVKACSSDRECQQLCNGDAGCEQSVACGSDGLCKQGSGIGDPAYALNVPTQQFRGDYIVLTPTGYQENHMTVVTPTGRVPLMDGARINEPPLSATPTTLNDTWDVYRLTVDEGAHVLILPNGSFGVTAYGYNCDVSYAYPGGLNLINLLN